MSTTLAPFAKRLTGFKARLVVDPPTGSLAVKDQLLISMSASPVPFKHQQVTQLGKDVNDQLKGLNVQPTLLTTVFAGLSNPGGFEDVGIFKVVLPPGQTIFTVTNRLRTAVLTGTQTGKVSPN